MSYYIFSLYTVDFVQKHCKDTTQAYTHSVLRVCIVVYFTFRLENSERTALSNWL